MAETTKILRAGVSALVAPDNTQVKRAGVSALVAPLGLQIKRAGVSVLVGPPPPAPPPSNPPVFEEPKPVRNWLLEFENGDKFSYLAQEGYKTGLNINWGESFQLFSTSPSNRSLALDLVFDIFPLAKTPANLYYYEDGIKHLKMKGAVQAISWGRVGELVSLVIEERWHEASYTYPPVSWEITEELWPDADSQNYGKFYPYVFGSPGILDGVADNNGSPGYLVDKTNKVVLIAGNQVPLKNVRIINYDKETGETATPYYLTDEIGNTVTVVQIAGVLDEGDELWVRWDEHDAASVAQLSSDLLKRTGLDIDYTRLAAFERGLPGLFLSGYIESPQNLFEWLQSSVFQLFSISLVRTTEGIAPLVWDSTADAVSHVEEGIVDTSRVQYKAGLTQTRGVSVGYGWDPAFSEFRRQLVLGEPLSENRIDAPLVADVGTASAIAKTQLEKATLPPYQVTFWLDPIRYRHLNAGDIVTLTFEPYGLENVRALFVPQWEGLELYGDFILFL